VTTSAAIKVGSTDLLLSFDPAVLQAVAANSTTLSGFAVSIDNVAGEVRTASASATGDALGADATLFAVIFNVRPGAPMGPSSLGLRDLDGEAPGQLGGVPPPVPAPGIFYGVEPGQVLVGAGSITCTGAMSAVDASVLLCRFVGLCSDADFPGACTDPAMRRRLSDWDCSGSLNPQDAQITLGIVVGRLRAVDTPLIQGCPAAEATGAGGSAAGDFGGRIELEVTDAEGRPGDQIVVEIRTKHAVTLGSTDLVVRYDPRVLEALWADSEVLSGFTYGIDAKHGTVRTASATATGDMLEARKTLFRVTFRVRSTARRRVSLLRATDGDGVGQPDLAGPIVREALPESVPFVVRKGRFRLLRSATD
jgi:hypothetical protein